MPISCDSVTVHERRVPVLAKTNTDVHVVPDQSLLESIEAAGVEVPLPAAVSRPFCRTDVLELEGELIHNDH